MFRTAYLILMLVAALGTAAAVETNSDPATEAREVTESDPATEARKVTESDPPTDEARDVTESDPATEEARVATHSDDRLDSRIKMYLGQVKVMPTLPVVRIAVGSPSIVSTNVLGDNQLILLAETVGVTSVYIWYEDGTERDLEVAVTKTDVELLAQEVDALLASQQGVTVREAGEHVIIDGNYNVRDEKRIQAISKLSPQIINLANPSILSMEKMVYLDVRLVEFDKKATKNLGINWNDGFTFDGPQGLIKGGNIPAAVEPLGPFFGIASKITSKINLHVRDGNAFILAAPKLSTRSGGEASFLAGGQIPLPVRDETGQVSVSFKDYGIKLNIKPTADDKGNILAHVDTSVSNIDASTVVQGIPGFLTRSTSAEINVKNGETIIISGLMNSDVSRFVDKVPLLGDLPVLGALFSSSEFKNDRSELMILVTPTVVEPDSAENRARIERQKELERMYKRFSETGLVE